MIIYSSHLFLIIEEKSLPRHDVRAIGLKCWGSDGSDLAASFPINCTMATFQELGTYFSFQQLSNKSSSASFNEWHFLNILYGIWSIGLGDDDDLDLVITDSTSFMVIQDSLNLKAGRGVGGSHSGLRKEPGGETYFSEKN